MANTTNPSPQCEALARDPNILARFVEAQQARGVVTDPRTLSLLYLGFTSRVLARPLSLVLKGQSSVGKSYPIERTVEFFPPSAFYALSSLSERALVYDEEPLSHRVLVVYEAQGLGTEQAAYFMRSLLSEGRVRYVTVVGTKDGPKPKTIDRPGPTGLITTTTRVRLDPELETRLLSVDVSDAPEQTKAVLLALATEDVEEVDLEPWRELQTWLDGAEHRVVVPFAPPLAALVRPVAPRIRRDFGMVLNLVRAHAILHQMTRERDGEGRVVAALRDYAAVRDLVADALDQGVGVTVPSSVRDTVAAVRALLDAAAGTRAGPSVTEVARHLGIDKSSASRRLQVAATRGFLRNLEPDRGRPAQVVLGDPLPADHPVLPTVAAVQERCGVAR